MGLNKNDLYTSIAKGFERIFLAQSNKGTSGDENENPEDIIREISSEMATVVSDAVEEYVKGGDIEVGFNNVQVVSSLPGTKAVVTPLLPAKMK